MRRLALLLSIAALALAPAALAQTSNCTSALSSAPPLNASLLGSSSSIEDGFGAVSLDLRGSTAVINASTLGVNGTISGLSLFRGSDGAHLMTFTDDANMFRNGSFSRTVELDPALSAEIAAHPSNFFFILTTARGAMTGPLFAPTTPVLTGSLNGGAGGGNFFFTFGAPNANGDIPISFDVVTSGVGNDFSTLQLLPAAGGDALFTLGSNFTATGGRITGTTLTNPIFAQQLLENPCGLTLALQTASGAALTGALTTGREVFIPVAGSTAGLLGNRWKTDLNLYNTGSLGNGTSAMVQFIPTGGSVASALSASTISLPSRGAAASRDITTSMFHGINGVGALRIISSGSVFANARVYDDQTANGKGTLGQSVPGLTRGDALRHGVLVGLTNVRGGVSGANAIDAHNARTNVGFFNPNDSATTAAVELRGSNGEVLASRLITLGALMHTQMPLVGANGLFTGNDANFAGATMTFLSGAPLFAYASIVDNVSGDASFVLPSFEKE
jgi:hypothetical protein